MKKVFLSKGLVIENKDLAILIGNGNFQEIEVTEETEVTKLKVEPAKDWYAEKTEYSRNEWNNWEYESIFIITAFDELLEFYIHMKVDIKCTGEFESDFEFDFDFKNKNLYNQISEKFKFFIKQGFFEAFKYKLDDIQEKYFEQEPDIDSMPGGKDDY